MTDALIKSITVPSTPQQAFLRFTSDFNDWWPVKSHSVSAGQGAVPKSVSLDPNKGGKITETLQDGTTSEWGEITDWQPGKALAFTWHPGAGPAMATHVALSFEAEGESTKVTLTHTGWHILADRAQAVRDNYDKGWEFVLGDCFGGTP